MTLHTSPAPLIKEEEDSEPPITSSPTDSHAPSKEAFYDHNGIDYSKMTCHYCRGDGHHQIHCPHYFCHICHNYAPKHLTAYCPPLKGMHVIAARPGSWLFLSQLKAYEDCMDEEYEVIKKRTLTDDTYSAGVYLNLDD
jgi:hypothetical protein